MTENEKNALEELKIELEKNNDENVVKEILKDFKSLLQKGMIEVEKGVDNSYRWKASDLGNSYVLREKGKLN